jgi:hypothetical protein
MAGTGTRKAKSENLEAKQEERDQERRNAERTEQQDLNQGMDTGTHDSTRSGVDWGPSYQVRSTTGGKANKKSKSDKTSRSRGGNGEE